MDVIHVGEFVRYVVQYRNADGINYIDVFTDEDNLSSSNRLDHAKRFTLKQAAEISERIFNHPSYRFGDYGYWQVCFREMVGA
jgi:hypothetical protein